MLFQVFLQVCIIATGNYNFFNFLTICLSISLLDDQFFYKRRSKGNTSRAMDYLSTVLSILVYGGIMYGTYVYYNLKITNDWTIQSDIGTYLVFYWELSIHSLFWRPYKSWSCFFFFLQHLLKSNSIISCIV